MISTLMQYFFVTFCILFLASSLVSAGEHGDSSPTRTRDIASVVKDTVELESSIQVPNEEGEKLIDSYKKVQGQLKQINTGSISEKDE